MRAAGDITAWLKREIGDEVGRELRDLDLDTQFRDLGLDSERLTALTVRLAEYLRTSLSPTVAWHFPTVSALADALGEGGATSPQRTAPTEAAPLPATDEPIAVVGLACRFPGAPDLEGYWDLLRSGTDAVTDIPAERWDSAALYDPDPAAPGRLSTRRGGFLTDVDRFDPRFFGISPREAAEMDPQQRLALELAWNGLQDAGIPPGSLHGSSTGVFLGTLWSDYARLAGRGLDAVRQHTATGQEPSIVPARISYTLGLQGPSIGVNTACSSSLVALHLACQSLRSGESGLALAGGVNLVLAPESSAAMSKFGAMSPHGRSAAFAASADGYVRAEGGGVVVLKRLSAALADGDRIHCLIRGSAVNNDGPSNGLTAPNPAAQQAMLRTAYARSGVGAHEVQYVEAHGTGTRLGDPIEAHALGTVLGQGRPADAPLLIGSVKTNIGHLEAAAGVAGLIKVALSMRHRLLPATLHHDAPNPDIAFDDLRLAVPTEPVPWPADGDRLLAGISSFGFGGTNCHVVVEGPPGAHAHPLPLSAPTAEGLRHSARALLDAVEENPAHAAADWCAATALNLSAHPYRAAATVRDTSQLRAALHDIASGAVSATTTAAGPRTAFVFSGQGSQWCGMGLDLLHSEPVFRQALEECDDLIRARSGISVVDELRRPAHASRLDETTVLQPAVFAVQVALAALWRSWGVTPDAVVGHSLGEVAAAHVAGALGLEDAVRVVCERSRQMSRIDGEGSVAVVEVPFADLPQLTAAHPGVHAAGANSTTTSVLSGDTAALDACLAGLDERGIRHWRVNMGVASHSGQCDPLLPALRAGLDGIRPRRTTVAMVSSVTAGFVDGDELGAGYWADNLRRPVLFAHAVELLLEHGYDHFIEVSPHPVLATSVTAIARDRDTTANVLLSQHRGRNAREVMLHTLGELHRAGRDLSWRKVFPADLRPAPLPAHLTASASPSRPEQRPRTLPLSAHSGPALRQLARETKALLDPPGLVDLDDLCHTATFARDRHEHRALAVFESPAELGDLLDACADGRQTEHLATGRARRATAGPVFLFSGQGAQSARMGCELFAHEPVFREVVERCDAWLAQEAGWSLIAELHTAAESSRIDETEITQPALFAVQAGLDALLRSWGVQPAAVAGHSAGEIAAAHCAGALTLEDALLVALHRGRILQKATGTGRMAAVGLAAHEVADLLRRRPGDVCVAAVNGPRTTLLSGETQALRELLDSLDPAVFRKELRVGYPSHSAQMREYGPELGRLLAAVRPLPGDIPVFSTIDGDFRDGEHFDAAYWVRTISEPVRFAPAVAALAAAGHRSFAELGPHPVLVAPTTQILEESGHPGVVVATMRRDSGERRTLREAAGTLWAHGQDIDWKAVGTRPGRLLSTPGYPWQRERYWIDPAPLPTAGTARTPLLDRLAQGEIDGVADALARDGRLTDAERALLPAVLRRLAPPAAEDPADWLHHLTFHPQPLARTAATTTSGTWIALTDDPHGPQARATAQALRAAGQDCVLLPVGHDAGPRLADALRDAVRAARTPCHGVLHLAAVPSDAGPEDNLAHVLRPALATVRALAAWEDGPAPRLWLVTTAAQPVPGHPVEGPLGHSALWGFGRVLALEHPELWGGLVDLDSGEPAPNATALVTELLTGDGEDQLAFRAGARHVARIEAAPRRTTAGEPVTVRADGGYLITGGLGGIGLVVARRLVEAGARHLVLVGRRAPDAAARAVLADLAAAGARVDVVPADVRNAEEVRDVVASFGSQRPPLRGVVHAAGVLDDGTMLQQDWDRYLAVLAPKVSGARHLDACTRDLPLDFFVLFSSFVAVLGSPGQGSYAAANAALDSLAHRRAARGLPATSVNWGPWQGVGMTDSTAAAHYRWNERGARTIDRDHGARLLDEIFGHDAAQLGVYRVDWTAYHDWLPATANRGTLALVHPPAGTATAAAAPDTPGTDARPDGGHARSLPDRLAATEPGDRLDSLISHLTALVADIAGFAADHEVDADTGFFQLGLDSLMKLKLVTRLRQELGDRITIPGTLPFDHPTCAALAAHLLDELALTTPAQPEEAGPGETQDDHDDTGVEALLAEVDNLSADQAARYLDQLTLGDELAGDQTHD
ncbi:SDR family NAD(P)-dependent oxidoreductase [Streptomyces echinatus]|uniref:SDR family NAD(P)-dependent oxidoreductase n=1 Tax=Streptomyces echinatus TaxID=67293 RepID=UPI003825EBB0